MSVRAPSMTGSGLCRKGGSCYAPPLGTVNGRHRRPPSSPPRADPIRNEMRKGSASSRSAGRVVPAALLLAVALGACGSVAEDGSGRTSLVSDETGVSKDEFIEQAAEVCEDLFYDHIEANDDIHAFERRIVDGL